MDKLSYMGWSLDQAADPTKVGVCVGVGGRVSECVSELSKIKVIKYTCFNER